VINKTMAQRWWPNENPIGQRITFDFVPEERPREVVGVVGDVRLNQTQTQPGPIAYLPHIQQSPRWLGPAWNYRSAMFYILRTNGNAAGLASAIRSAVAEVDGSKPAGNIQTVEQNLRDQVSGRRVYMLLLSVFGVIAAVLAAVGIYGVMAYAVTQRTREIGIRIALGASRVRILTMMMRQALTLMLLGLVVGIAGALMLNRLITSILFATPGVDPITFVAVAILLTLVGAAACLIPSLSATGIDPTLTLRKE